MKKFKTQTIAAILTIALWIGVGTFGYVFLEGWTLVDSFYFSVSTLTTVGYGDLVPTNNASKVFTAIFILTGVSVVVASLGIIGSTYINSRTRFIKKVSKKKN